MGIPDEQFTLNNDSQISEFWLPMEISLLLSKRILLSILLLLHLSAKAQTNESTAQDFFAEAPLILTVSRLSKPLLESPASVSVIDRQMIEASGAREVADLFRLVPGFVVGFHSGHAPVVTYHGLGQEFHRQIQVLIDGRSVFIPSFGGVPWSNLPILIDDIERIEVIRGPNAVTYGANAFLATINIITRHAAEDLGTRYSITTSDNANPDIEDAYLRIGSHLQNFDWRLSLGAINDSGFASINDSKRSAKINLRMDLSAPSNQFWTLQLGSSDSINGRGFPPSEDTATDIERSEEVTNSYFNLQWESVRDASTTILQLTHTRQKVIDNFDPGPLTLEVAGFSFPGVTTFIDFDRISERTDFELTQTDDIGDNVRLVYGGSMRQDKVKSLFLLNEEDFDKVDTNRLFGVVEWRLDENWLLDLGLMLEDTSLTEHESSPRVSLIRKFGKRHALRVVASAAKRNPILWEHNGETEFSADIPSFGIVVLPTWIGNDEIEPESIMSYEIGLRSQYGAGLGSDVKLFRYKIDDQIVHSSTSVTRPPPINVTEVATPDNSEDTEVRGIEVAFDYTPDNRFQLHSGFSLVDVESSLVDFEESIPDYTIFITARYHINMKHEVSAAYYYLDEISWIDSFEEIPDARRLDLRYAYHMTEGFNVEVIGQNLFEDFTDYEEENLHDQVIYLRLSGGF